MPTNKMARKGLGHSRRRPSHQFAASVPLRSRLRRQQRVSSNKLFSLLDEERHRMHKELGNSTDSDDPLDRNRGVAIEDADRAGSVQVQHV